MPEIGDIWYRIQEVRYARPLDEFERPVGESTTGVNLHRFYVTKVTPKGVWLGGYVFVLLAARKRYACPTIEEAYASFMARKTRQLSILNAQIRHVERAVLLARKYKSGDQPEKDQNIPVETF